MDKKGDIPRIYIYIQKHIYIHSYIASLEDYIVIYFPMMQKLEDLSWDLLHEFTNNKRELTSICWDTMW